MRSVRAASLIQDGELISGVRTGDGGTIAADEVVMCTGASTELLESSGLPTDLIPPLIAAHGTGVVLEHGDASGPQNVLRTPNRAFACGLHLVPRNPRATYVGATNRASRFPTLLSGGTVDEVVQLLDDARRELMPELSGWRVGQVLWGVRPLPVDGKPFCGRTALPGLSVITGTYRNGVVLAPHLARMLVKELDGGAPNPILTPTRTVAAADVAEGLGVTAAELSQLFEQAGWSDRLGEVLRALLLLALDSRGSDAQASLRSLLGRYGRAEMIPEGLLELLESMSGSAPV